MFDFHPYMPPGLRRWSDAPREPDPPPDLDALAQAGDFIGVFRTALEAPPGACSSAQLIILLALPLLGASC